MVKKVYTDNQNELTAIIDSETNQCLIQICQPSEEIFGYGYINLNSDDLEELIKDLQNIKKQIDL